MNFRSNSLQKPAFKVSLFQNSSRIRKEINFITDVKQPNIHPSFRSVN